MLPILVLILLSFINDLSAALGTCAFDMTLHQELHNVGFHRNITYKVILKNTYQEIYGYDTCFIALDQKLPVGVFASADELADLGRLKKLMAIARNKVNIELPADETQPMSVFILSEIQGGVAYLWLPVHARYHRAAKRGGSYHNKIEPPRVFIRCPHLDLAQCNPQTNIVTYLCSSHCESMCIWKEIYSLLVTNPEIIFTVPIGDLDHNDFVMPVTMFVVAAASLYLLKSIHDYKMASLVKKPAKL